MVDLLKHKQFKVVTCSALASSGRPRLIHADSHHDSVGRGGEDLQSRAASALQNLERDI